MRTGGLKLSITAVVLFFVLVQCGCATTVPGESRKAPATAKGKGAIYVFNATAAVHAELVSVLVADREICALNVRQYTRIDCVPDTYKVAIERSPSIRLTVAAGEFVYLKFSVEPESPMPMGPSRGVGKRALPALLVKIEAREAERLLQVCEAAANMFGKQ